MSNSIPTPIREAFTAAHGFEPEAHCVVLAQVGSHSHGTYIPPTNPLAIDDVDYMGVIIPPPWFPLGLREWDNWTWKEGPYDVVFYSLQKFVRLLCKSNPNVLGLLWMRDEDYVWRSPMFEEFLSRRALFSCKQVYQSFTGYAGDQQKRMTAFDKSRMAEYETYTREIEGAGIKIEDVLTADENKLKHLGLTMEGAQPPDDGLMDGPAYLREFRQLHRKYFSGYMGAKRKALVRQFDYDVKNAAHLVRLLRMGCEFLETGTLNVYRTHDAQELKDIKQGRWPLDQVQLTAEGLVERAKRAYATCALPDEPATQVAEDLCVELYLRFYVKQYQTLYLRDLVPIL